MSLEKIFEKYDFFRDDFVCEIDHVDIFCENCAECPLRDECPNVGTLGRTGLVLKELHETFLEVDIDSRCHKLTSDDNGDLDRVVCGVGGVLPVKTVFTTEGTVSAPMHNFLLFEMKDGRRLLYDVDFKEVGEGNGVNDMMYG